MTSTPPLPESILFFDGVCNLCNASVDFILRHEKTAHLRFCAQQTQSGRSFLQACCPEALQADALVLWHQGRCYLGAEAALRIAGWLRFPFNLLQWLRVLPRPLRRWLYRQVARRRYRWFGRRPTCRLPRPEERARFWP